MNKIFKKENLKPLLTLITICVAVAVLVAAVNLVAAPIIEAREREKVEEALRVVLPGAENFEEIELNESYPEAINSAYRADIGYVFVANTRGKEAMTVMCGVDSDGKLVQLDVISESETPDYKNRVFPLVLGDNGKYCGKDSESLELELVTGATLTSNGIYNAVKASLDAYTVAMGGEISGGEPEPSYERAESELLSLASQLVSGSAGFTKVELEGEFESLVSVYKENGGRGYVAYVLVISENYGTVESEALIYIGNDAKIKDINKLTWKTSDAIYGYVPPSAEEVDEFYSRLPGNNNTSIDGVELVTNATNTSTNVVSSMKEALAAVEALIRKDMPTPEEEVISLAGSLVGGAADFEDVTPSGTEYLKRIYRDKNGSGYVAYVVVISENYGTVESEALIHIGNDAKIKNINKLTFKTSDAIYGYVPPTLEEIDAFYSRLPGSDHVTIDGVELVTNATNTSTNVVNSIKEALSAAEDIINAGNQTPRALGIAILCVIVIGTAVAIVFLKKRRGGVRR